MRKIITTIALMLGSATAAFAEPVVSPERVAFQVNEEVNLRYRFTYEAPGRDFWRLVSRSGGDCEDFVLRKREELLSRGFEASDLAVLVISRRTSYEGRPSTEGHVVLYIRSLNLVLDAPAEGDRRKNLRPISLERFYEMTGFEYYCVADNLTEGEMPVNSRCAQGSRGNALALNNQ